jgi:c-di-GMP-binding flagellar brake protein YcgR
MNHLLESKFVFINIPDGTYKGEYVSRILSAEKGILVMEQLAKGHGAIEAGIPLSVDFFEEGELYTFSSEVQTTTAKSIMIRYPIEITKKQQRNYRRVPITFSVDILVMDYDTSETKTLKGKTLDVSGGGMRLMLESTMLVSKGDLVGLEFSINNDNQPHPIIVTARVVRVEFSDDQTVQICAVEFIGIKDEDRYILMRSLLVN